MPGRSCMEAGCSNIDASGVSFSNFPRNEGVQSQVDCKIMPGRSCMEAGCSNIDASGVSFSNFPRNEGVQSQVD